MFRRLSLATPVQLHPDTRPHYRARERERERERMRHLSPLLPRLPLLHVLTRQSLESQHRADSIRSFGDAIQSRN